MSSSVYAFNINDIFICKQFRYVYNNATNEIHHLCRIENLLLIVYSVYIFYIFIIYSINLL